MYANFRVEQVDESNSCQQTAANDFQARSANQRTERTSRVSIAFLLKHTVCVNSTTFVDLHDLQGDM